MPDSVWTDFSVASAVIETRFDEALLLWDRAGAFWAGVARELKELKPAQAGPNKTVFRQGDRFELSCELAAARIVDMRPDRPVEDIGVAAPVFFDALRNVLEVNSFSRIGFRVAFQREFSSIEAASEILVGSAAFAVPKDRLFGADGEVTYPEVAARWNGKANSMAVRMLVQEQKTDLNFQPGIAVDKLVTIKAKSVTSYLLTLDFDYFTNGEVLASKWSPSEWTRQAMHLIRRDGLNWLNKGASK